MKRAIPIFLLAAVFAAGCSMTRPPVPGDGSPPATTPSISPADQCLLFQLGVRGAETTLLAIDFKDPDVYAGIDSGVQGVKASADAYCEAVARGEDPQALHVLFDGVNAALDAVNARLRAQKLKEISFETDVSAARGRIAALLALPGAEERIAAAGDPSRNSCTTLLARSVVGDCLTVSDALRLLGPAPGPLVSIGDARAGHASAGDPGDEEKKAAHHDGTGEPPRS